MAEVVIVDSGGANLASLQHALQRLGAESRISRDPADIAAAARVLLPGVGSAASAMTRLREHGLERILPALRQPVLGICLGMQLLYDRLDEGDVAGLGVVPGRVARLKAAPGLSIPHMGWNTLQSLQPEPLLRNLAADERFYYVHSFAAPIGPHTTAACEHGEAFTAVVSRNNFHGVQFHPERSGPVGARLLANFLDSQSWN